MSPPAPVGAPPMCMTVVPCVTVDAQMTVHVVHGALDVGHVGHDVAETYELVLLRHVTAAHVQPDLQRVAVVAAADCQRQGAGGGAQHVLVEAEQTTQLGVDVDEVLPRL